MNTAVQIAPRVGIVAACWALGVARATFYRAQALAPTRGFRLPRARCPWRLRAPERQRILALLHAPAYVDKSPHTVFAMLLDAGCYLASVSSFYRLLREASQTRGRRNELTHPAYAKPELLSPRTAPAVVLGHHQAEGTGQVGVFSPVRDPRRV